MKRVIFFISLLTIILLSSCQRDIYGRNQRKIDRSCGCENLQKGCKNETLCQN